MQSLRTKETETRYIESIKNGLNDEGCFFCDPKRQRLVKKFTNFVMIENDFPYDEVAETCHILFPIRHIKNNELTEVEYQELCEIKNTYMKDQKYDYLLEGVSKLSIPGHVHYHALTLKHK